MGVKSSLMAIFSQAKAMTKKVVRRSQRRERVSRLAATAVQKPGVRMPPVRVTDDLGVLTAPTLIW
ncbi:hypothetical protein [Brasilonema bromeliae]|uniref:Uncharacterized protein n=1 Tax=Brasilonema bromeliae SPC951 TaxID=385972 RepID=A0ABX1P4Q0_9CYAN|nr:hypothetical protein [Brasilonema bromeliae]NMG19279.1 hypothetical protein [Brasilonema bromeliae SPC951]